MVMVKKEKDQAILNLIDAVKNEPSLWNTNDKSYHQEKCKNTIWERVAKNSNYPDGETAKHKWKYLRDNFVKCNKRHRLENTKWAYFNDLEFLAGTTDPNDHIYQQPQIGDMAQMELIEQDECQYKYMNDEPSIFYYVEESDRASLQHESEQHASVIHPSSLSRSSKRSKISIPTMKHENFNSTHEMSMCVNNSMAEDEDNEHTYWAKMMAKRIAKLTPYQQSLARQKIELAFHDVEFGPKNPPEYQTLQNGEANNEY